MKGHRLVGYILDRRKERDFRGLEGRGGGEIRRKVECDV